MSVLYYEFRIDIYKHPTRCGAWYKAQVWRVTHDKGEEYVTLVLARTQRGVQRQARLAARRDLVEAAATQIVVWRP